MKAAATFSLSRKEKALRQVYVSAISSTASAYCRAVIFLEHSCATASAAGKDAICHDVWLPTGTQSIFGTLAVSELCSCLPKSEVVSQII